MTEPDEKCETCRLRLMDTCVSATECEDHSEYKKIGDRHMSGPVMSGPIYPVTDSVAEMSKGLIYLASPYSHPNAGIRIQRFDRVCMIAADLMRAGHVIFSPIAHSHPIALHGLPDDLEFWKRQDRLFLDACVELWVLRMQGWKTSKGIAWEILVMQELCKPVRYLSPVTLELEDSP